jgi:hypothetical protein
MPLAEGSVATHDAGGPGRTMVRVFVSLHVALCALACVLHVAWMFDAIRILRPTWTNPSLWVWSLPLLGLLTVPLAGLLSSRSQEPVWPARWVLAYGGASLCAIWALRSLAWHDIALWYGHHGRFGCHEYPSPYWVDERTLPWLIGAPPALGVLLVSCWRRAG